MWCEEKRKKDATFEVKSFFKCPDSVYLFNLYLHFIIAFQITKSQKQNDDEGNMKLLLKEFCIKKAVSFHTTKNRQLRFNSLDCSFHLCLLSLVILRVSWRAWGQLCNLVSCFICSPFSLNFHFVFVHLFDGIQDHFMPNPNQIVDAWLSFLESECSVFM